MSNNVNLQRFYTLVVPVYLEIVKSSDNLRNRMKLRTIKWRNLMPFFKNLPVESAKI